MTDTSFDGVQENRAWRRFLITLGLGLTSLCFVVAVAASVGAIGV